MKVWDVFPYWCEGWAARARLQLWVDPAPEVDYRPVALTGDRTHRGHFLPPGNRVQAGVEVIHTVLTHYGDWGREQQQRDAVRQLLPQMDPDDLVLLCDADELVDPRVLPAIVAATEAGPVKLKMEMYCCGVRWRHRDSWRHAAACRARDLPERPSEALRLNFALPKVPNAGWHLTYYGDRLYVDAKLSAFAHAEYDTEDMRRELAEVREYGTGWIDAPLTGPLADILTGMEVAA